MFKSTHNLLLAGVNRRAFLKSSAALGLGAVASPAIVSNALSSSGQLSIINWDDELPDPVIPEFEKATGIKVNSTPFSQNEEQINKLQATGGEGFDLVFDATGNRASMESAFGYVAHGGTLVLVSVVTETITFSDPEFHKREMTLIGSRNALRADFETVIGAMEAGRVPLQRLLTHRTNLAGVIADLPRWTTEKKGLMKALVEVG
jgi:threonine dehydrogenase-like Zn-dependent dehydrogenase